VSDGEAGRWPIRVLLVDEHNIVRQGLRMFLGLDVEIDVVREGAAGAEGLRLARAMPRCDGDGSPGCRWMDGITTSGHLRRELPDTEVIALTSVLEDDKVIGAVRARAIGYLLKDTQADELIRAIKEPPPDRRNFPARRRG